MKILTPLFILFFITQLTGQALKPDPFPFEEGRSSYLSVHLTPLTYLAEWSRLRVGASMRKGRYGYTLDVEYGNSASHGWVFESPYREYQFFGIRPEMRKYFRNTKLKNGFAHGAYISLEAPLNYATRTVRRQFKRGSNYFNIDSARERRVRSSLVIKLGTEVFHFRRILLDAFWGLGAGFQSVTYFNEIGLRPADTIREFSDAFGGIRFYDRPLEERNRIVLELALGFRVGYRIGK